MQRPRYLICDEMTAMLDPATTAAVVAVLREETRAGLGVLAVTTTTNCWRVGRRCRRTARQRRRAYSVTATPESNERVSTASNRPGRYVPGANIGMPLPNSTG